MKRLKKRQPKQICCDNPDIKMEGCAVVPAGFSDEYHCYNCDKTWTEIVELNRKSEIED